MRMRAAGEHFSLTLMLYHPRSRFADIVRADVAAGRVMDYASINIAGPASTDVNPFLDPTREPQAGQSDPSSSNPSQRNRPSAAGQCGRTPYCSRASDCQKRVSKGCKCIADKGIQWWSSNCRAPLADIASGAGRGLLEGGNATTTTADINLSSSNTNSSRTGQNGTAVTQSSSIEAMTDYLSNLACPCNCTYISKKCCTSDSGIVHEHPRFRLGALTAPREGLECDEANGGWREKR